MSIAKEIEIIQEDYNPPEEPTPVQDEIKYKLTIPLSPGKLTQTQIITPFNMPFVTATLMTTDPETRCWIYEISSRVVKIKAITHSKIPTGNATLYVRVTEGLNARRFPL
jgi:hypothetical protein